MKIDRRAFIAAAGAAGAAIAAGRPDWKTPVVGDPQRPVYHFMPPRNWMNDPNGLIQWKGEYHLFYQFAPDGPDWTSSPMHWGHAKSADLIRWQHLPIALFPDQSYDKAGVWSGTMAEVDGTATAMYTAIRGGAIQSQCVATSTDMLSFTKVDGNPVIAAPPPRVIPQNFRDPFMFRHDDAWMIAVGAGFGPIAASTGSVLLYRSNDLRRFKYLGPLFTGSRSLHGAMFECPAFFQLGDRWILMVSPSTGKANYFSGAFNGRTFVSDSYHDLDLGGCLYAPQVFTDDQGRKIMFGWLRENYQGAPTGQWQGVQTLPRELTLGDNGRLRYRPVAEVESLRGPVASVGEKAIKGVTEIGSGAAVEILVEIDPGQARRCGLMVRRSARRFARTEIAYDAEKKRLEVDRQWSSFDLKAEHSTKGADFAPAPGQPLRLRVFVDHSVIEVFAEDLVVLSSRVYPDVRDADGIAVFAEGGEARLLKAEVYKMQPVMERKTV